MQSRSGDSLKKRAGSSEVGAGPEGICAGAQCPRVVPPPGDTPAQPPVPPAPVMIPKAPATPPEEPVDIKPLIAAVEAQNLAIRKRITHRFLRDRHVRLRPPSL